LRAIEASLALVAGLTVGARLTVGTLLPWGAWLARYPYCAGLAWIAYLAGGS
jgi:hypothetical protein